MILLLYGLYGKQDGRRTFNGRRCACAVDCISEWTAVLISADGAMNMYSESAELVYVVGAMKPPFILYWYSLFLCSALLAASPPLLRLLLCSSLLSLPLSCPSPSRCVTLNKGSLSGHFMVSFCSSFFFFIIFFFVFLSF